MNNQSESVIFSRRCAFCWVREGRNQFMGNELLEKKIDFASRMGK